MSRGGARQGAGRKGKQSNEPDTNSKVSEKSAYPPSRLAGLKPIQPGQVLNPAGRPKGSRNKLGEDFLRDMLDVWATQGKDCIERTAKEHPEKLVGIVANLLPKEFKVTDELSDLTDEQLAALHGALDVLARNAPVAAEAVVGREQASTRH